jgi:hypothetical protein
MRAYSWSLDLVGHTVVTSEVSRWSACFLVLLVVDLREYFLVCGFD